jgi:hypothetical protein
MSFVSKLNYTRTLLKRKIYKILKRIVRSIKREDGGMADVGGYKEHIIIIKKNAVYACVCLLCFRVA